MAPRVQRSSRNPGSAASSPRLLLANTSTDSDRGHVLHLDAARCSRQFPAGTLGDAPAADAAVVTDVTCPGEWSWLWGHVHRCCGCNPITSPGAVSPATRLRAENKHSLWGGAGGIALVPTMGCWCQGKSGMHLCQRRGCACESQPRTGSVPAEQLPSSP